MHSPERCRKLIEHAVRRCKRARHEAWGLISLQDPPERLPSDSDGLYYAWHPPDPDEIWTRKETRRGVAFYVLREGMNTPDIRLHEGKHRNLAATVTIETECGTLAIVNVYNHELRIDLAEFLQECARADAYIINGDFNVYIFPKEGDTSKAETEGKTLRQLIATLGLRVCNDRSSTFHRGNVDINPLTSQSTIDLTLASPAMADRIVNWRIATEVDGFSSDHRVIETILDVTPISSTDLRYRWPSDPDKLATIRTAIEDGFGNFSLREIASRADVDSYAQDLVDRCRAIMTCTVPLAGPRPPRDIPHTNAEIQQLRQDMAALQKEVGLAEEALRDDLTSQIGFLSRSSDKQKKLMRSENFWKWVDQQSKELKTAYRVARLSAKWIDPKPPQRMGNIKYNGKTYTDTTGITGVFRSILFGETANEADEPITDRYKDTSNLSNQVYNRFKLREGELEELIVNLPTPKAPGHDQIPNEFLQLGMDTLLPYLTHLYNHCIKFRHFPDCLKDAKTILLRKSKDKKPDDEHPKSYRPIALESSIAKLYERFLADRLKEFCAANSSLPFLAFGTEGKCTAKAIMCLLNQVYRGWCREEVSTLFGFDIEGAYNNVDLHTLFKILEAKGVPYWIYQSIKSFLHNRRTTLELPGHDVEPMFWVRM